MNTPDMSKMKHDCPNQRECLELLQSILDGEATSEQKDNFLKNHLEECMPCYNNYHLELAIRNLLKKKCSGEAPQELVNSIKQRVVQNLSR
jgi:mycothiol system anti-sigma-R factor